MKTVKELFWFAFGEYWQLWTFFVVPLIAIAHLASAQIPAPEPAVDNLMRLEGIGGIDSSLADDIVHMVPPRLIYPVWKSDGTPFIPDVNWKTELVELWQQYKAECYADSTVQGDWYVSNGDSTWRVLTWGHKQPTAEDFLDWLEGRVK